MATRVTCINKRLMDRELIGAESDHWRQYDIPLPTHRDSPPDSAALLQQRPSRPMESDLALNNGSFLATWDSQEHNPLSDGQSLRRREVLTGAAEHDLFLSPPFWPTDNVARRPWRGSSSIYLPAANRAVQARN
jgi:hypothetical protein